MGNKTLLSIVFIVVVLAIIGVMLFRSPQAEAPTAGDAAGEVGNTEEATDGDASTGAGSYEPYTSEKLALANEGAVVLFFRASWCPTCRALDSDIRANLGEIPEGVTILDVNYDTETALKQKYGVTYQHTLVQVGADGTMIAKWTGSPTLEALVVQVR
ncbi:thioredoxin family protein [Candidatus Wolfebacteria bacterium]|nr:thioredoxin family protein [Candidatus Wolfebacteria bacterium]